MTQEIPPWITVAETKLGQHEIAGGGDNAFIVECLRRCGLPDDMLHDQTAWCGAFAGYCMDECGLRAPKGRASALNWSQHPEAMAQLHAFRFGCVAVFTREGGHHVAFALAELGKNVVLLGGNQQNRVGIDPRSKSLLVGYYWPAGVP